MWKTAKAEKSARISFATPELLWKVLTAKRWELLKALCGAGVAFKLAQALMEKRLPEKDLSRLLLSFMKVVAIATIADAVPTWHPSCPETGTTKGARPIRFWRKDASSIRRAVTM